MPLPLGDDDYLPVSLPFQFQFVNPWETIFVGSNGNLTMLAGSTDSRTQPGQALENGPPRIAPWWDDLNPEAAPYPQGVYVFPFTDAVDRYVVRRARLTLRPNSSTPLRSSR